MTIAAKPVASSIVFLALLAPSCASAQVVISEIMYDPAGSDSGREWIELHNTGASDVMLVGGTVKGSWRVSDGSNHTLTDPANGVGQGSLVVPAGGYLVIAQDPAEFASGGEYAGGAYSVVKSSISLNNAGGTIALLDGNGAVEDSVTYASSMGGSGDGASLIRDDGAALSPGAPSPGAANAAASATSATSGSADADTDAGSTEDTSGAALSTAHALVLPVEPQAYAYAGPDRTVIAGADVELDGEAFDRTGNPIENVRYLWNFGDGATAEGESVLHHWSHPGQYDAVLTIADDKYAAEDSVIVTAEKAKLALSALPDGSIVIENDDTHTLDLSGWHIHMNTLTFDIPERTRFLAGASVAFSPEVTNLVPVSHPIELLYPNGEVAVREGEADSGAATGTPAAAPALIAAGMQPALGTQPIAQAAPAPSDAQAVQPVIGMRLDSLHASAVEPPAAGNASSGAAAQAAPLPAALPAPEPQEAAAAAAGAGSSMPWALSAAALSLFGAGTVVLVRRRSRLAWDIVEDTDETV